MDAHFFMRPNLASLVMVDLDDHDGSLQDVLSLAPRALVQTSPRCFQIWYTLDQRFAASDAATVTRELSQILGGDTRSARTTQVGRMPGSINRKPQKMAPAMLLHSCLQNLNEAQYLHMVRPPLLRLQGGGVHVEALKDKPVVDRSREDWGIACRYFESHPAATVDDAVRDCQLTATRPNQEYYVRRTFGQALRHVREQLGDRSVTPASESSAAGSGGVVPAQLGSGLGGSHSGNGVTRDQVWQIVQEALRQRDRAEALRLLSGEQEETSLCFRAVGQWERGKDEFTRTQWDLPAAAGSACKSCCQQRVAHRQTSFADERKRVPVLARSLWPQGIAPEFAARWILEAGDLDLPSENLKSYQAMLARQGVASFAERAPAPQKKSALGPEKKLQYLSASHQDMAHLGGRDGILQALKSTDLTWPLMKLDATFFVERCQDGRGNVYLKGQAGDVIGWDLKTVVPVRGSKWTMLLAIDFTSSKVWTWDLDFKKANLQEVQSRMIKFYQEVELPCCCWTDNGSQFRNLLSAAIELTLGVRAMTIPAGRPQSNGIVEIRNKILDRAVQGDRSRLGTATVAYNQKNLTTCDLPPETLWRLLRPQESRWRYFNLKAAAEAPATMTDGEWHAFLDATQWDKQSLQDRAKALHAVINPLRRAMQSKQLRAQMKTQMKWLRRKHKRAAMPLLAGDIVLSRATQYTTRCGPHKFETKGGGLRTWAVLQVRQGFVQVQDAATGEIAWRHDSHLKLMPRAVAADNDNQNMSAMQSPETVMPAWDVVRAAADGACLFRSLAMGCDAARGATAAALTDDAGSAAEMRETLLMHLECRADNAKNDDLISLQLQVEAEMLDDPIWMQDHAADAWSWPDYFAFMSRPGSYGTAVHLQTFVESHEMAIEVWENIAPHGKLTCTWREGEAFKKAVRLLRSGNHYDLLVPRRRLRHKTSCK
ncbi:unnamed protein product [Effrenium voratum]|nr:unnamed protein product [Effrenium voratum]